MRLCHAEPGSAGVVRAGLVSDRVRARYELTLDEFRGVFVSDEQVDRLLASAEQPSRAESPRPAVVSGTPLATIAGAFGLDDAATLGSQLFGAAAVVRRDPALRRALTDASVEGEARSGLARAVFGSSLAEPATKLRLVNLSIGFAAACSRPEEPHRSSGKCFPNARRPASRR